MVGPSAAPNAGRGAGLSRCPGGRRVLGRRGRELAFQLQQPRGLGRAGSGEVAAALCKATDGCETRLSFHLCVAALAIAAYRDSGLSYAKVCGD
jgi:hypothetical protein